MQNDQTDNPCRAPVSCLLVLFLLLLLAVLTLVLPEREISLLENRVLTRAPQFSLKGLLSGQFTSQMEEATADQLAFRDSFISLSTAEQALLGRRAINGVILGRNRMFERSDGWSARNVRLNASALGDLQEMTGLPVHLLAVPSAASVYADAVPAEAPMGDDRTLLSETEASGINVLPVLERLLEAAEGETLFYRTDHHWTADGACIGYLCACEALELDPMEEGTRMEVPGFYGSFYARCPLPWIHSEMFSACLDTPARLWINGQEMPGLADPEGLSQRDKYAALFYGNPQQLELLNEEAKEGTLFVIRDSYANALLPMLSRHYRRIIAVDGRTFAGDICEAVLESEAESVLCVYGLYNLATGRSLSLLEGL